MNPAELQEQIPSSTNETETQQSDISVTLKRQQCTLAPTTSVSYKDAVLTKPITKVQNVKVVQPLCTASSTKLMTPPRSTIPAKSRSLNMLPAIPKVALETDADGFVTLKAQQSTKLVRLQSAMVTPMLMRYHLNQLL